MQSVIRRSTFFDLYHSTNQLYGTNTGKHIQTSDQRNDEKVRVEEIFTIVKIIHQQTVHTKQNDVRDSGPTYLNVFHSVVSARLSRQDYLGKLLAFTIHRPL